MKHIAPSDLVETSNFKAMFTLSFLVVLMSCPVCCFVGGENYMSDYRKLTQIPRDIPRNVKKIYLNNNCIASIEGQAFAKNTRCTNLRLDWNRLTEVGRDVWTGLVALQWLSLEHNDIQLVNPYAFADLPNLKGLYLDNNKLTALSGNILPLKQAPVIEILTLHKNSLRRKDLGWLSDRCYGGRIEQYTIQNEVITCPSNNNNNSSDKRNSALNSTQLTQDDDASNVDATTEDTTTGDYQTTIVDETTTITWITDPQQKYSLELPGASKNKAHNREYSHQDLVMWILISAGGATVLCITALVLLLRSRSLITAGKRGKKLKRIHQRQENRPPPPLPTPWRNAHPPTNLQGLQEYQSLVENPPPSSPGTPASTTQTNQSSDTTYAYPYQHMLGRFIAFMTMYQRRRPQRRPPPPVPPETIPPAPSGGETSNGYLEPVSVSNVSARRSESQKSESSSHYEQQQETSPLANGLTTI